MSAPVLALLLSLFLGIATSAPATRIQIQQLDETSQVVEVDDDREKVTPQHIDMLVSVLGVASDYVPQEVKEFLADMTDADKAQLATFVNDLQIGEFVISEDQFTVGSQAALLKEKYPAVYVRGKKLHDQLYTKFERLSQETKTFLLKPAKALYDFTKQSDAAGSGPGKVVLKALDLYKETFASYASAAPIVRTDVKREWPELHQLLTSETVLQKVGFMKQLVATQENLKKKM